MKEKKEFGFLSQGYAPPRAESVAMMIEGSLLLTASDGTQTPDGDIENMTEGTGSWG